MAVSNTDDHLRNHGFILTPSGWRLSPLFDVNPVPYGDRLSLNISEFDNRIDLSLAIEVADYHKWRKAPSLNHGDRSHKFLKIVILCIYI